MNALPPKPIADRDTQPFWDGVAERRLLIPRCTSCGRFIWQPRPLCPACHAPEPEWMESAGDARVASWTVIHPPVLPVWQDEVPLTILLVELDDAPGVRMLGQLVDHAGELIHDAEGVDFGARAVLRWHVDEAGQTLPAWAMPG